MIRKVDENDQGTQIAQRRNGCGPFGTGVIHLGDLGLALALPAEVEALVSEDVGRKQIRALELVVRETFSRLRHSELAFSPTALNLIAKIGENIQVRRFEIMSADNAAFGSYLHGNRIGVLVEVQGGDTDLARGVAMHIAASKPLCVDESGVPQIAITNHLAAAVMASALLRLLMPPLRGAPDLVEAWVALFGWHL